VRLFSANNLQPPGCDREMVSGFIDKLVDFKDENAKRSKFDLFHINLMILLVLRRPGVPTTAFTCLARLEQCIDSLKPFIAICKFGIELFQVLTQSLVPEVAEVSLEAMESAHKTLNEALDSTMASCENKIYNQEQETFKTTLNPDNYQRFEENECFNSVLAPRESISEFQLSEWF